MVHAGGWGAPVTWHEARVAATTGAAEGLLSIQLDVGTTVANGFVRAGQYLQVRAEETSKPAFIAVASAVGSQNGLELLVKASPTTEALCALGVGALLQVSDVQGKGFVLPPNYATQGDVWLFGTGSGLSPLASLLDTPAALGGLAGLRGVRLVYGARTPAHVPFAERLRGWQAAGVEVTFIYSKDGKYVQDALAQMLSDGTGKRVDTSTTAVLVGQKPMTEAVIAQLTAHGVPRERIVMNF